jgi:hypothetical protein
MMMSTGSDGLVAAAAAEVAVASAEVVEVVEVEDGVKPVQLWSLGVSISCRPARCQTGDDNDDDDDADVGSVR